MVLSVLSVLWRSIRLVRAFPRHRRPSSLLVFPTNSEEGIGTGFPTAARIVVHLYHLDSYCSDLVIRVCTAHHFLTFSLAKLRSSLLGCLFKVRGFVTSYAYTTTINTLANIAIGIFFVWTLFHRDNSKNGFLDKCDGNGDGDGAKVTHWFCQRGFELMRVLIVIGFVIVWIFMLGQYWPSCILLSEG